MKRALALGLLLGAGLAFADRILVLTWSSSLSTVDGAQCSRGLADGGFVASAWGTARLSTGVARDPDTLPDGGPYTGTDTQEAGPVAQCVGAMTTLFNGWKPNRGF